ncbi:MAG: DNA-directed RNA polymerase subunit beta [Ruoffia tabacinasalis]|uniref:DNA-directed RNA polymerase subunit beta n=1 Tax=Ruoffia halotolerans TaxID=2748684 RepID=A0A839A590_9LACT|nr:DNA-directed RNA polymerase subunit beta [Ruoffia halotolerans]MBA5729406.1 DNA-directed RNA polymerase subunit beta [Ruoffia halotolerans]HBY90612.1 DNA-directed RNA polymerase subunit beta [Aerococcaceae bacterium]
MSDKYIEDNVLLTVLKTLGKVILFLLFIVLFFVIGLFIGYSIIGDGNYWEVLNQDTWQHILDFIR